MSFLKGVIVMEFVARTKNRKAVQDLVGKDAKNIADVTNRIMQMKKLAIAEVCQPTGMKKGDFYRLV